MRHTNAPGVAVRLVLTVYTHPSGPTFTPSVNTGMGSVPKGVIVPSGVRFWMVDVLAHEKNRLPS
jgi:hypothetical protein